MFSLGTWKRKLQVWRQSVHLHWLCHSTFDIVCAHCHGHNIKHCASVLLNLFQCYSNSNIWSIGWQWMLHTADLLRNETHLVGDYTLKARTHAWQRQRQLWKNLILSFGPSLATISSPSAMALQASPKLAPFLLTLQRVLSKIFDM